MTYTYVSKVGHHWFSLVCLTHYLNQCRLIPKWTIVKKKLHGNQNQIRPFFHEYPSLEWVRCNMATIKFRLQCVYSSKPVNAINYTITVSDNGSFPVRRQAITWTNPVLLLFRPLATNFNDILFEIQIFIHECACENIVCKIGVILSGPQCVKRDDRVK